eukprot:6235081-Amphidinium_carterae.2
MQGYLTRCRVLREFMDAERHPRTSSLLNVISKMCLIALPLCKRIYFPDRLAWEFLVLLNLARKQHGLAPASLDHAFEPAGQALRTIIPPSVSLQVKDCVHLSAVKHNILPVSSKSLA